MYWIYRTNIHYWRNQEVHAKLWSPSSRVLKKNLAPYGFTSPSQYEPYGVDPEIVCRINPKHPHPDNYFQSAGFTIHSKRMIDLMTSFNVNAEIFPCKMQGFDGSKVDLDYYIFHSLEGVIDGMDHERSGWKGDFDRGIKCLMLDYDAFEHRPIFKCAHIFLQLMRDDLKQEIIRNEFTGFDFLPLCKFCSGSYGSPEPEEWESI